MCHIWYHIYECTPFKLLCFVNDDVVVKISCTACNMFSFNDAIVFQTYCSVCDPHILYCFYYLIFSKVYDFIYIISDPSMFLFLFLINDAAVVHLHYTGSSILLLLNLLYSLSMWLMVPWHYNQIIMAKMTCKSSGPTTNKSWAARHRSGYRCRPNPDGSSRPTQSKTTMQPVGMRKGALIHWKGQVHRTHEIEVMVTAAWQKYAGLLSA
jgi:hypothetical protein